MLGFPKVKTSPSNAGDASSIPGWEAKIPHSMEQLGLCVSIIELVCSVAHMPQLESPCTARKNPE